MNLYESIKINTKESEGNIYTCNDCGKTFEDGQIFNIDSDGNPICPYCGCGDIIVEKIEESDEEPKITAYSIAQFEADRLGGKAYDLDDSDSLRGDHAGFIFNFRGRNYKCEVSLFERGSATKESELKESYDTWNVIEDTQSAIKNLINNLQKNGDTVQTSVVIDALNSILKDIEKNSEEAW